jgi:hypothetical protein
VKKNEDLYEVMFDPGRGLRASLPGESSLKRSAHLRIRAESRAQYEHQNGEKEKKEREERERKEREERERVERERRERDEKKKRPPG